MSLLIGAPHLRDTDTIREPIPAVLISRPHSTCPSAVANLLYGSYWMISARKV